jgi:16S rRNA processing protein RimM
MTARKKSANPDETGSPESGEPVYLSVGVLRRPHGLRGEMLMEVLTDFPQRLNPGADLFVGPSHKLMTLASARGHNDGLLVRFEGIETPEQAGKYRGNGVFVRAEDRPPLPEGEFYHHEVIGLRVINENDEELGVLSEILLTGANDVYIVKRPEKSDLLLPAIEDVILKIDPEAGLVRVRLLPGLDE